MKHTLYNKYLQNQIELEEIIHFFDNNNFSEKETKDNGIIYTPKYIADYIVEKLEPKIEETIFEPSIGHGIFLFSLLEYIEKKYKLNNIELKEYFFNKCFGQDLNENNIKELKELVILYFKKKEIIFEENDIKNFYSGDTLFSVEKRNYDLIIGNPPYVRTKNIEENYLKKIKKEYYSCAKGNIDLYFAFIEYALKYSTRSGYITPNSWLYSTSGEILRTIAKDGLIEIIDFKQKKIFQNAATYTSIFIYNKQKKEKDLILYKEDIQDEQNKNRIIERKDFFNNNTKKFNFVEKVINNNKQQNNIEIIFKTPIATLKDNVFVNPKNLNNKDTILFKKISKIKNKEEFLNSKDTIINPYFIDLKTKKYKIKEENELNEKTLQYLIKHKNILLNRDKGKTEKYEKWFSFGRKQGLNIFDFDSNNHIIIIPGMINIKEFIFFSVPLKEIKEQFLFSSGFLLEVKEENIEYTLKELNSNNFKTFTKNEGKIWKGKTEENSYYSLTIKQLKEYFFSYI
jgi:tRNA1(Val) A37 N6-methylase TrmN6